MGQASSKLRRVQGGYAHWCPGCSQMHVLPSSWNFDGNLESPTFTPSFRHSGVKTVYEDGKWTGDWARDANGNTVPFVCHYTLILGTLHFCNDSTHALASTSVPLPDLPEGLTDETEP